MKRKPNVFLSAQELMELGMCPFNDPLINVGYDEPCPICGALGSDETEDIKKKCAEFKVHKEPV